MTSLDGINGRSIQTLLRGENDSKQSDEFQANENLPLAVIPILSAVLWLDREVKVVFPNRLEVARPEKKVVLKVPVNWGVAMAADGKRVGSSFNNDISTDVCPNCLEMTPVTPDTILVFLVTWRVVGAAVEEKVDFCCVLVFEKDGHEVTMCSCVTPVSFLGTI